MVCTHLFFMKITIENCVAGGSTKCTVGQGCASGGNMVCRPQGLLFTATVSAALESSARWPIKGSESHCACYITA